MRHSLRWARWYILLMRNLKYYVSFFFSRSMYERYFYIIDACFFLPVDLAHVTHVMNIEGIMIHIDWIHMQQPKASAPVLEPKVSASLFC